MFVSKNKLSACKSGLGHEEDYRNVVLCESESARVSFNVFPPKIKIPGHIHPGIDQVICCVLGSLTAHSENRHVRLTVGDVVVVEADEEHWFQGGDEGCISLSVLAGKRGEVVTRLSDRVMPLFEQDPIELIAAGVLTDPREAGRKAGLDDHSLWTVEWVAKNICAGLARQVLNAETERDVGELSETVA